jgi:hypothetical protein
MYYPTMNLQGKCMKKAQRLFIIQGEIFNTLLTVRSETYVLIFNKLREIELKNYLKLNNLEAFSKIFFIKPKDLHEKFTINRDQEIILLIDEYKFFKEEELWNKVLYVSGYFDSTIAFQSVKFHIIKSLTYVVNEKMFIHHILFNLKLTNNNIIIICSKKYQMEQWVDLFQANKITAKCYNNLDIYLNHKTFMNYKCHLIYSKAHFYIDKKVKDSLLVYDYKSVGFNWYHIFKTYNSHLNLSIVSLEKTRIWKSILNWNIIDTYLKTLIHRLWEFFYV